REALAGLWNRSSIVWKVVIVFATLGSAVAIVLLLVALFRAEPERELRVGDTAAGHGLDFSLRKIACNKRRKDLPEELPYVPIKGELCFATFKFATVRTTAGPPTSCSLTTNAPSRSCTLA